MMWNSFSKVYDPDNHKAFLAKIQGSEQEQDLTLPANCNGFGRIRHFRRFQYTDWIPDPLPIDPALNYLKRENSDILLTECFQIALCNLNCWYCFVPKAMKLGSETCGAWFSANQIIHEMLAADGLPQVIVLSGGNPEIAPAWPLSLMKALEKKGVTNKFYLWSDDALSLDYFHEVLSKREIEYMVHYTGYGKVCCFKGYNDLSCQFNTQNNLLYYHDQLRRFRRYYEDGFDLYGYVTFTTPELTNMEQELQKFFDDLRRIHPLMPLRVIPLRITLYESVRSLNKEQMSAYENQFAVLEVWLNLIAKNFDSNLVEEKISRIHIR